MYHIVANDVIAEGLEHEAEQVRVSIVRVRRVTHLQPAIAMTEVVRTLSAASTQRLAGHLHTPSGVIPWQLRFFLSRCIASAGAGHVVLYVERTSMNAPALGMRTKNNARTGSPPSAPSSGTAVAGSDFRRDAEVCAHSAATWSGEKNWKGKEG